MAEHHHHHQKQSPSPPPASSPPRPSKVARFSPDESDAAAVTMAAAAAAAGIDGSDGKAAAFTFMQTQELQYQVLIYKYMAAGVPVPLHLVLPIWKTVAAVSGGALRYPTLMGWGSLCLDYRNCMEPEPGRCRRTDGKKWRCARDVVPEQKYCERHVHRGRNRSRKHVEGSCPGGGSAVSAGGGGGATDLLITAAASNSSSSGGSSSIASPPGVGKSPSSVLAGGC